MGRAQIAAEMTPANLQLELLFCNSDNGIEK
jgi:hypothetical protein